MAALDRSVSVGGPLCFLIRPKLLDNPTALQNTGYRSHSDTALGSMDLPSHARFSFDTGFIAIERSEARHAVAGSPEGWQG